MFEFYLGTLLTLIGPGKPATKEYLVAGFFGFNLLAVLNVLRETV
jgi:hypothetical protein